MIGVAGKNGHAPIELFGQHDAAKLMRPRHATERNRKRDGGKQGRIVPVRAANGKDAFRHPLVAPVSDPACQPDRIQLPAAFVEQHDNPAFFQPAA